MKDFISSIIATHNQPLQTQIQAHLDDLIKPPGSLGRLEEIAMRYCHCRGSAKAAIKRMQLFTFAGDHGITQEKITPYPSEVTPQMVMGMAAGHAAVSVMCRAAGIDYTVVDVGVANKGFPEMQGLLQRKVAAGTRNFAHGAAMTAEECARAVKIGFDLVSGSNADLIGVGEMGIGNSASASALYSLLLDCDPEITVGPGTGSAGSLLEKKKRVIADAVRMHRAAWDRSPADALCRVGGFEIAAMAGAMFGGGAKRVPVVVDGFIAGAAALVAMRIEPRVRDYLYFAHASAETFHAGFLQAEGIRPLLALDMRLGEGTGSALAMQIIRQAMECYHKMATFSSAGISKSI